MMHGLTFYTHDRRALWSNELAWAACRSTHHLYRRQSLRKLAILLQLLDTCDIRPLIAGLAAPVLAISGAEDPVVPPAQSAWLAEHLPNVELQLIERAGHVPIWEAGAACEQMIKDWLARHPVPPGRTNLSLSYRLP
jgi:pimeloyl-ACP methyl ester carboxylesterase